MSLKVLRTNRFVRQAKKYIRRNPEAAESISRTIMLLSANPDDPKIKTHKLKGDMTGFWSVSAGYDLRIIFKFTDHEGQEAIMLHGIGTHDEVY